MSFASDALSALQGHSWPGNVRELRNVVERAASLADSAVVKRSDLFFNRDMTPAAMPSRLATAPSPDGEAQGAGFPIPPQVAGLDFKESKQRVVDAFEQQYLKVLLDRHDGNITRSAQEAGLTRYHLRELLKRHGLANVKELKE